METKINRGSAGSLASLAAAIILFGAGVLVGVGLGRLTAGELIAGAFFTLLGAAMVWAAARGRSTRPEA